MWEESGRGESRRKIWDLLADWRCSQAVLDFLSTTDVGRRVPALAEGRTECGVRVGTLGAEGKGEERRVDAEELGVP